MTPGSCSDSELPATVAGHVSFAQMKQMFEQVLSSVGRLQRLQLLHYDIKPDNFMVSLSTETPPSVHLIDYDSVSTLQQYHAFSSIRNGVPRTDFYCSPDCFMAEHHGPHSRAHLAVAVPDHDVILKQDLWPLGLMAIELFCDAPFGDEALEYIKNTAYFGREWAFVVPTAEENVSGRMDLLGEHNKLNLDSIKFNEPESAKVVSDNGGYRDRLRAKYNLAVVDPQIHVDAAVRAVVERTRARLLAKLVGGAGLSLQTTRSWRAPVGDVSDTVPKSAFKFRPPAFSEVKVLEFRKQNCLFEQKATEIYPLLLSAARDVEAEQIAYLSALASFAIEGLEDLIRPLLQINPYLRRFPHPGRGRRFLKIHRSSNATESDADSDANLKLE